jgi:glycosyltransferase involved in cell wall biosynthesis/GT2 family glycosyltransferase
VESGGDVRVLVNSDALAPVGGVEVSSLQVCRELVHRGHQIDLLYRDGGELERQWRGLATSVRQVPSFLVTQERPVRDLPAMLSAVRAASGLRPDALWLNRAEHLVWGLLASRTSRAPLVCHLRTHPHFPAVRQLARGVSRFVAVSSFIKDLWVDAGLHADSVQVVPNGVDEADYPVGGTAELAAARHRLGLSASAYVVLYYGRLHPEKGIDRLLEAWQRLALPADEATLLLAGEAYPTSEGRAYAQRIRELAPAGVRLAGMQRDVVPLLHAADTVVLPAQWQEPFGRVVAEGLISGRPVVASRVGGVPEQLTGELSSLLFDPGDAGELAARLGRLRQWRRDDPGLGERCAEHARTRLSLRATADGVENVISTVVESRRRRPRTGNSAQPTRSTQSSGKAEVVDEQVREWTTNPEVAATEPLTAAVVICAYTTQRWELLRRSVASVRSQSVLPRQIVLVIDHSDELLARSLQEWPPTGQTMEPAVQVIANRYDGRLGSARNTGIEQLNADVVAFLDDDAAADPTWLETLLTAYRETGAVAVGGAPQPQYQTRRPFWFPIEFNWVYGCHYQGLPEQRAVAQHLIGAAMSARVEALIKVGGFHSDNHDDMDMCHRIAAEFGPTSVLYEPRATVQHTVTAERVTWAYFWRRCFYVNRGKVLAFADMGHAGNLSAELRFAREMADSVGRRIRRGLRGDLPAFGQAAAIVIGLGLAGVGHIVGTIELRLGRTEPSLTRGLA